MAKPPRRKPWFYWVMESEIRRGFRYGVLQSIRRGLEMLIGNLRPVSVIQFTFYAIIRRTNLQFLAAGPTIWYYPKTKERAGNICNLDRTQFILSLRELIEKDVTPLSKAFHLISYVEQEHILILLP